MSVWTVADVAKELHDVATLLKVRNPNGSPADAGYMSMASAMVNTVCCKIKGMKCLTAGSAIELYAAVAGLNLDAQFKQQLTSAIDAALSQDVGQTASTLVNTPQSLTSPHHYLTQKAWDVLTSQSCSYWDGLHVLADRLELLGVRSLRKTLRRHVLLS